MLWTRKSPGLVLSSDICSKESTDRTKEELTQTLQYVIVFTSAEGKCINPLEKM